ncbi:SrtB family sortase [Slackia equolifaciens]|uniref:SrtB family sortase n=2 Tax=Slackia equolifaciens TaxID=498718 RepID=A0A3N0AZC6_9ACTN|nr:SrtB family sortase [Slackia equolifaciens]
MNSRDEQPYRGRHARPASGASQDARRGASAGAPQGGRRMPPASDASHSADFGARQTSGARPPYGQPAQSRSGDRARPGQVRPGQGFDRARPSQDRPGQARPASRGVLPPVNPPADQWDVSGVSTNAAQNFNTYSRANYGRQMMDSRNRGKRRIWTVVLVIASLVLVACLAILGVIAWGYYSGTKTYDEIAQSANVATEANALADMTVDWDALLAQNPDTVAWIYMPGTSIDYPVVRGDSDEEYLRKDFAGNEGGIVSKGAIFLSVVNSPDFSDDNNFIYGHNMNDDTMFAHLVAMEDQAAFDAARTFYVFTPTCNYRCTALALDVVANTETSIIQPTFADSATLAQYAQERIDAATAKATDVDLGSISKLFTLITCGDDYATTRAVLFGGVVETAVPTNAQTAETQESSDQGDEAGQQEGDQSGDASDEGQDAASDEASNNGGEDQQAA